MAYVSKSTFQQMVNQSGAKPGDVVRNLLQQGHQIEGYDQFKQQQQTAAAPQESSNPVSGAFDWLHKNTQGFRDWIDNTAEKTGLNAGARAVQNAYQYTKNSNPIVGAVLNWNEGLSNAGAYAVPAVAQGLGNQVKALGDITGIKPLSDVGSGIKGVGDYTADAATQSGFNPNSFSGEAGRFLGNLGSQVPAMAAGSALLSKAGTGASALGASDKVVNAGKFIGGSLLGTEAATTSNQGRLADPVEMGRGLVFDTALLGIGKFLGKGGKSLMEQTIPLTPNQRGELQRRGVDLGENLLKDVGFVKNKDDYLKKLSSAVSTYDDQLTKEATKVSTAANIKKVGATATKLTEDLDAGLADEVDRIIRRAPESDIPRIQEAYAEELAAVKKRLQQELGNSPVGPNRLIKVKRIFDGKINYDKTNPIANVKDSINKAVADKARELLDAFSPNITNINAKMGPLIEAASALRKKGGYSGFLSDVVAGSGGFGGGGVPGALKAILGKRLMQSLPGRTGIATGLGALGKILQQNKPISPVSGSAILKNLLTPTVRTF